MTGAFLEKALGSTRTATALVRIVGDAQEAEALVRRCLLEAGVATHEIGTAGGNQRLASSLIERGGMLAVVGRTLRVQKRA